MHIVAPTQNSRISSTFLAIPPEPARPAALDNPMHHQSVSTDTSADACVMVHDRRQLTGGLAVRSYYDKDGLTDSENVVRHEIKKPRAARRNAKIKQSLPDSLPDTVRQVDTIRSPGVHRTLFRPHGYAPENREEALCVVAGQSAPACQAPRLAE